MNMKKIFKEEESIEIIQILRLINNIGEYLKIYNHDWREHEIGLKVMELDWKI